MPLFVIKYHQPDLIFEPYVLCVPLLDFLNGRSAYSPHILKDRQTNITLRYSTLYLVYYKTKFSLCFSKKVVL